MRGVKEDRHGGEGIPPFSMEARAMMRMMGSPSMAITRAIVEGGDSARTKQSKRDAPPQAWTIPDIPPLQASGVGQRAHRTGRVIRRPNMTDSSHYSYQIAQMFTLAHSYP
jgi:hypothetical protein